MKKRTLFTEILTIMLVFGFILVFMVGCSSPKSLAKQAYDLSQQALNVGTDVAKAADIATKLIALESKVEKLSDSDKAIYEAELARLITGVSATASGSSASASGVTAGAGGDAALVGKWAFLTGDYVYFFWDSKDIEFKSNGTVFNYDDDESGGWTTLSGGRLIIEDADGYSWDFTYTFNEDNMLVITDEVDDVAMYRKR